MFSFNMTTNWLPILGLCLQFLGFILASPEICDILIGFERVERWRKGGESWLKTTASGWVKLFAVVAWPLALLPSDHDVEGGRLEKEAQAIGLSARSLWWNYLFRTLFGTVLAFWAMRQFRVFEIFKEVPLHVLLGLTAAVGLAGVTITFYCLVTNKPQRTLTFQETMRIGLPIPINRSLSGFSKGAQMTALLITSIISFPLATLVLYLIPLALIILIFPLTLSLGLLIILSFVMLLPRQYGVSTRKAVLITGVLFVTSGFLLQLASTFLR